MPENPLVGVWKLVSCDAIRGAGSRIPVYGKHPIGRLVYDAAGNMSVHIMRAGRAPCARETKFSATDEEMKAAYEGYEAYFSTYSVDASTKVVSHKVLGSLFPNWTGSTQVRYYELEGRDRLLLSSAPLEAGPAERPIVQLIWERLE